MNNNEEWKKAHPNNWCKFKDCLGKEMLNGYCILHQGTKEEEKPKPFLLGNRHTKPNRNHGMLSKKYEDK